MQILAGIIKEEAEGGEGADYKSIKRYAQKLSSKAKLQAPSPFENQEQYSWDDFDREVRKQNPDPAANTGQEIYITRFDSAEDEFASSHILENPRTWDEILDEYISQIEETYASVDDFAKVFTIYEWHGPYKDLAAFVSELTVDSYDDVVGVLEGAVANFITGEAQEITVLDTTQIEDLDNIQA